MGLDSWRPGNCKGLSLGDLGQLLRGAWGTGPRCQVAPDTTGRHGRDPILPTELEASCTVSRGPRAQQHVLLGHPCALSRGEPGWQLCPCRRRRSPNNSASLPLGILSTHYAILAQRAAESANSKPSLAGRTVGNTQKTRLAALRPCWLGSGRLTPRCSGNKKLLDDKVPWKEGAPGGGEAGGHTLAVTARGMR